MSGERIDFRNASLSAIAVMGFVFLLRYAQELLIPVVLASLVAFALNPFVSRLAAVIPRALAATLVVLAVIGAAGAGIYAMRRQAVAAIESLPDAAQRVRLKLRELSRTPARSNNAIAKIKQAAQEIERTAADAAGMTKAETRGVTRVQIEEPLFRASDYIWLGSMSFAAVLSQAVMILFLVFFLLSSGDLFKRKLVRVIGSRLSEKRVTVEAINEINAQIERFLLIQILTGAIVGVLTTLALWALGVNQPAFWGLAAGVLNSIPYFGAIIVTVGLALVAFLQFGTLLMTVEVAGIALVITSLEGFLLTPALMGKAAGINGVAMFLSLLFWSWLWGVVGLIVAVPIMMVIKTICDRTESLNAVGELLGER